jgi:putrescine importer
MTGVLWSFLHRDALIAGLVWAAVGVIYAVVLSRVTGRKLSELTLDETAAPADLVPAGVAESPAQADRDPERVTQSPVPVLVAA